MSPPPLPCTALLGASALGLTLVSHFWPMQSAHLTRQTDLIVLAAATIVLWYPAALALRGLAAAWAPEPPRARLLATSACLGFGALISAESCVAFSLWGDNIWLHKPALQAVLRPLLCLGDAAVVAGLLWALLTLALPPRAPEAGAPAPGRLRGGWHLGPAFALALVWANAATAAFVRREDTAHYWDFAGYWLASGHVAEVLARDPAGAWRELFGSFRDSDYTLLPALAPGAVLVAAGDSRLAYELAVANLYGGAVVAASAWAVARVRAGQTLGPAGAAGAAALAATCAPLWQPALLGYLDFGGVALCLLALGVYLSRPASDLGWQHALALGVLLAALVLFRRWYSFWVVAFLALALAEAGLAATRRRALDWRDWRPALAAGGIALALVAAFAWPMVLRVAGTSYAEAYAAYRADAGVRDRLGALAECLGWVHVLAFAAAVAAAASDPRTRRPALFAAAMPAVILAHFYRVQDMGPHHRLLLAPSYLLAGGLALARLAETPRRARAAGLALLAALALFVWGLTFEPRLDPLRATLAPWATGYPTYPERRGDIPELLALAGDADREARARGTTFAVVASSLALNQFHVLTVHRSQGLTPPAPWRQAILAEVDKVGGYPANFFGAGVVAVADPPQTHLRPEEQVAIRTIAAQVWAGTGVGAAFAPTGRVYRLDGGASARLFVRTRPSTAAEREAFDSAWRSAHPGLPVIR